MYRKNIFILLSVLLIILLSATACSSNQDETVTADEEEQNVTPSEQPEDNANLDEPPPPEEPTDQNPDLDSHLNQLILAEKQGEAEEFAQTSGIELIDGRVRVIIECEPGQVDMAASAAINADAIVELSYKNLIQALVPISKLTALVKAEGVRFIRLPVYAGDED